ncbi:putative GEM-like protein 8 [Henckelia pumila]|uniref:putative GEM-like protein 8 n=1 Tax=Henckelia pumila TaxID=405737 RepID=UPI003C6E278E
MEKQKDEDQFNHPLNAASSLSEPVTPSYSDHKNKSQRRGSSFAFRIREHVRLGPRFSETVKGKLNLIKKGGREKIFKGMFGLSEGEKLLKASQCYLSTTAGPIAGNLFISTHKIGFLSERSITVHSSSGGIIRTPYKLSIPVKKIKGANESENVNNPSQKYIEIVTHDNFEFWFMGFVRYEKALSNLQTAISMST